MTDQQKTIKHKILIANRGEIGYRILRTAKRIGLSTIAIYTEVDAVAPHVLQADESAPVGNIPNSDGADHQGYMDSKAIISIAKRLGATLIAPGYGFLSENEGFAQECADAGLIFLGPQPETIRLMGLKHEARAKAKEAGVPIIPGSELLSSAEQAVEEAAKIGYPVMLKATGGGGGMGLQVCQNAGDLRNKFESTQQRSKTLFKNDGLFLEKYFSRSRHVEVQVFGNGSHVIHMGERECSIQRRHQKVVEETPSPFMLRHPDIRGQLCDAAVRLTKSINYKSAGTIEMLVDDESGSFYFLEMNTRIQVEHAITEAVNPGLDIVELMIRQGISEFSGEALDPGELVQSRYKDISQIHAIEARVYLENPTANFKPCPGLLQLVAWPEKTDWLRIDTWVETGTRVSPYYDPLVCKIITSGATREEAIIHMKLALKETKVLGPPSNMDYLKSIFESDVFVKGDATTTFLQTLHYVPRALDVLVGGLSTTVQDYPGRLTGFGVPRSGPMDSLSFRAANGLVGNNANTEALEITLVGPRLKFHVEAVIAVTGAPVKVTIDKRDVSMWTRLVVPAGSILQIGTCSTNGFRAYLAVRGGFPDVPEFLGSKSTFAGCGIGGVQGRALAPGDQIVLADDCVPTEADRGAYWIPEKLIPDYPSDWTIYCTAGPQGDEGFVTNEGISTFYDTAWKISASSNRMGLRLEGPKIEWARPNGGQGGSHPSNILDNGYAFCSINLNGDTPIILTHDGPSMGGFLCMCTVVDSDIWKLGQLKPGNTVQFRRISLNDAQHLTDHCEAWLTSIVGKYRSMQVDGLLSFAPGKDFRSDPKLAMIQANAQADRPEVVFRQAGDQYILVEFGPMLLDLNIRTRIHLFEIELTKANLPKGAIRSVAPCIRSTLVHFDPALISQGNVLEALVKVEQSLPLKLEDQTFPSRVIHMPLVLDDRLSQQCIDDYMRTTRSKAVYLPSNVQYLADNNGLQGGKEEALSLLHRSPWLVLGIGFYLACPFLVPVDPRCRLIGAKMNPSRTMTPEGALGVAGPVAAIYPVASPGGYQLFGRSLSAWRTWGKGKGFSPERPWLLRMFDRVKFDPVSEEEYQAIEKRVASGTYEYAIEESPFSVREYNEFVESIQVEVEAFRKMQAEGIARTEAIEAQLLKKWEEEKAKSANLEKRAASEDAIDVGLCITSNMTASVYKIKVQVGDVLSDPDQPMLLLEAMKTEIEVPATDEFVGMKVKRIVVKQGDSVNAGDPLVMLEN